VFINGGGGGGGKFTSLLYFSLENAIKLAQLLNIFYVV